jgi:hypothetical protein
MKLQVKRVYLGEEYTIGRMYIDYEDGADYQYFCDTLEDIVRDTNKDGDLQEPGETKVYGETAIPYGTYTIIITKHLKWGIDVPYLTDVKEFTGVLIHMGSTPVQTLGCILVGFNTIKGQLTDSTNTFKKLMGLFKQHPQKTYKIEVV